jgi:hypothetical protein
MRKASDLKRVKRASMRKTNLRSVWEKCNGEHILGGGTCSVWRRRINQYNIVQIMRKKLLIAAGQRKKIRMNSGDRQQLEV